MFNTGSLIQSVNIYLVENILHTVVVLVVVLALVKLLRVRDAALRAILFLVPVVIPLISAPSFYLFFPQRQKLPVLAADRLLNVEKWLSSWPLWSVLSPLLTSIVLAIFAFLLVKGLVSLWSLLRLPSHFRALPEGEEPRLDALLAGLLGQTGVSRPRILVAEEERSLCCAFGLHRSYLLLSRGLMEHLDDASLKGILAHEVAHIKRRDGWLNFLLLTFRNVLFFNPLVHFLCDAVLQESEMATDRLAISLVGKPAGYAQCLLDVGHRCREDEAIFRLQGTRACFVSKNQGFKRRLTSIMDYSQRPVPYYQRWLPWATAAPMFPVLFFLC
ncbi:MAG: M56 family metallopeptidase [Chloroflexi bacterium]|nr:M56 family metallopeptidase [Chloroflexota bacterium]